jgi:uncharacterized protein YndB with AHSA1/START domain
MAILADTDIDTGTIVSVGVLPVPPAVVWRGFAERELLERWYGSAEAPARFETHELRARTRSIYRLCGPVGEGGEPGADRLGFLQFIAVDPARLLVFSDGARTPEGAFGPAFLHATVELEPVGSGTRVFVTQQFSDRNRMEQLMLDQFEAVVSSLT